MQIIKYLCGVAIVFTSCRASRTILPTPNDEMKPTIAAVVSANNHLLAAANIDMATEQLLNEQVNTTIQNIQYENVEAGNTTATTQVKKKITSFTQLKEMAKSGEVAMSKKDLKTLNRLEKHYKGNYNQFRADAFEFTNKAKIIGGVGLLGLLLAIITGSAFGWFLFIVAALAFLLRYLNIIAF